MDNKQTEFNLGITTIDTSIEIEAGKFDPFEEQEELCDPSYDPEDYENVDCWECFDVPSNDIERIKEFDHFCRSSFNENDWSRLGDFLRFRNKEDATLFFLAFAGTRD